MSRIIPKIEIEYDWKGLIEHCVLTTESIMACGYTREEAEEILDDMWEDWQKCQE